MQLIAVKITSVHRHNHITSSATLRSSDWKTARFLVISSNPFLSREWSLSSTSTIPYHCYLTILPCGLQGRCMCWQSRWPMKPHANHSPNKRAGNSSQVSQRQGDERSSSLFATSSVFLEESLSYHVTKFRETAPLILGSCQPHLYSGRKEV